MVVGHLGGGASAGRLCGQRSSLWRLVMVVGRLPGGVSTLGVAARRGGRTAACSRAHGQVRRVGWRGERSSANNAAPACDTRPSSSDANFYGETAPIALHPPVNPSELSLRSWTSRRTPARAKRFSGPDYRGRNRAFLSRCPRLRCACAIIDARTTRPTGSCASLKPRRSGPTAAPLRASAGGSLGLHPQLDRSAVLLTERSGLVS